MSLVSQYLSEADLQLIDDYIDYTHPNIKDCRMDTYDYLCYWVDAKKKYLFSIFPDTLQYSAPLPQDPVDIHGIISTDNEIGMLQDDLIYSLTHPVLCSDNKKTLPDSVLKAIKECGYNSEQLYLADLGIHVHKGEKYSRIVRKIAKKMPSFSEKYIHAVLSDVENRLSVINNFKSLKGNMCLSIHPMDYLTMSDNSYNWRTCVSWRHELGSFSSGAFEMCFSPNVIVAYIPGDRPFYPINKEDGRVWNNKRWRQLFIVTPEVIVPIRQYPVHSDLLEQHAVKMISDMTGQEYYLSKSIKAPPFFETDVMYNDLQDKENVSLYIKNNAEPPISIEYGTGLPCICCGNILRGEFHNREDELLCKECEDLDYL